MSYGDRHSPLAAWGGAYAGRQAFTSFLPILPYCNRCYGSWKRYGNKEYPEKHCHICGTDHTATLLKPACLACFRKFKDSLEFATS